MEFPHTKHVIGKWILLGEGGDTSFPKIGGFPMNFSLRSHSISCRFHSISPMLHRYTISYSLLYCFYFLTTYQAPYNLHFPLLSKSHDVFKIVIIVLRFSSGCTMFILQALP